MLTESQTKYLQTIPADKIVFIKPFDPQAGVYAKKLIADIQAITPEIEVFWSGALALDISGLNDIDLSILVPEKNFKKYLPSLIPILGKPTKESDMNVLWRIEKEGHHIDAYLSREDSGDIKMHKKLFEMLKSDSALLDEYRRIKESANGLSFIEYQKRKYEFYNKILGLQ
ncbi:MAG: hypothetical protein Q8P83_00315 [bacterium]|nr:hypothetical protein [bacterium]